MTILVDRLNNSLRNVLIIIGHIYLITVCSVIILLIDSVDFKSKYIATKICHNTNTNDNSILIYTCCFVFHGNSFYLFIY